MEVMAIVLAPPDARAPTHLQAETPATSGHTHTDKLPPATREGGAERGREEGEEEALFQAKAVNVVDAERDRATPRRRRDPPIKSCPPF